jgi:hypothetical protein
MVGPRAHRLLAATAALSTIVGTMALVSPSAGADVPKVQVSGVLNDSPLYTFTPGAPPARDVPVAVGWLSVQPSKRGLSIDVTQLARFDSSSSAVGARVSFYPRSPKIAVTGGIEFSLGSDTVNAATVERASDATETSAEGWKPDPGLATVKATYKFPTTKIEIDAKGAYAKMLRDPFTAVGLDLYRGEDSQASIQPSVRVSIGDLTGAHPGLVAGQGNALAGDLTPQPWITRAVSPDFIMRVDKYLHKSSGPLSVYDVGPDRATVRLWALGRDAEQIRLFEAPTFQAVQPGARFEPYTIVVFTPTDMTAAWRRGDAYSSTSVGVDVKITRKKNDFVVSFPEKLSTDLVGTQVVIPGDSGKVLLATSLRHSF